MPAERAGRAYTRDQMQAIAARQDERNALSTRIACWYAVHCDYFKRRVESPDKLCRRGAHEKKTDE